MTAMEAPENIRFTESHEWITTGSEPATVGISDHAQSELGEVVYVELPDVGRTVEAGEAVAVVESVKAASDIYAPVSGEIVEVNARVAEETGLINSDAFGEGWLFKIKVSDLSALDDLLDQDAYRKLIG